MIVRVPVMRRGIIVANHLIRRITVQIIAYPPRAPPE